MAIVDFEVSYDSVRIGLVTIWRPRTVGVVQWFEFWEGRGGRQAAYDRGYDSGYIEGYKRGKSDQAATGHRG